MPSAKPSSKTAGPVAKPSVRRLSPDALEEAEKIRNAAHRAADSETKKAIEELRSQMADEIVQAVEATLKEKLDMKKHVKLIDNALKKVVLN